MLRLLAIVALGASCAGCVTNPYPQTAEAQRMLKICQYDVGKATASAPMYSVGDAVSNGIEKGSLIRQCMDINGYRPS